MKEYNGSGLTKEQLGEGWRFCVDGDENNEDVQMWCGHRWRPRFYSKGMPFDQDITSYRTRQPYPMEYYKSKENKLKVLEAWMDGKTVEYKTMPDGEWEEWFLSTDVQIGKDDYWRIKPEPTQENIDKEAWQNWHISELSKGEIATSLQIWKAALAWERSREK